MTAAVLDASEICDRLHRDISANNVILVRDQEALVRRALVIDWECSTTKEELKTATYIRSVRRAMLAPSLILT